jgi:UDP-N-acetylmuramoylalanine--D-glutamate ligase
MAVETPRRVLIVGLGRSGMAAACLAEADGAEVWATDLRTAEELAETMAQLPQGTRTFLGSHPTACLDGVELVIVSPGVAAGAEILEQARQRQIEILTELEFAWQHRSEAQLVAVTGSNGKSTVTVLTAEMLRAGGINAVEGGNLGTPASSLVQAAGWDAWVLEVSSFQAEMLVALRPSVGIFLNLSQDHLERHHDLDSYLAAKQSLFKSQCDTDIAVLNADEAAVAATPSRATRRLFSLVGEADAWLCNDQLMVAGKALLAADQLGLSGRHNIANALAAALAASRLGISHDAICTTLQSFQGLEHRHRTVAVEDGIRWVNDSKATNVGATLAALPGYPAGTVHLILGGLGKDQDFSLLIDEVRRAAAGIYLIGADAPQIGTVLKGAAPQQQCGTLAEAVQRARAAARPGDTVLLAPACASFDQFSGYEQRGNTFVKLVRGRG